MSDGRTCHERETSHSLATSAKRRNLSRSLISLLGKSSRKSNYEEEKKRVKWIVADDDDDDESRDLSVTGHHPVIRLPKKVVAR